VKRFRLSLLCLIALLPFDAHADRLGVVLIHGKQGIPGQKPFAYIIQQFQNAGIMVAQPNMCWSRNRIYDRTLPDCMADIDAAVAQLRSSGATSIAIVGHSLGGVGAIYYGSTHDGLKAIVAMAPGPAPGFTQRPVIVDTLKRAHDLMEAGQGDVVQTFTDFNTNASGTGPIEVHGSARMILSFLDMTGPANLVADTSKLRAPIFWVSGTRDRSQLPRAAGFDKAPANPLNRYEQIDAGHLDTPDKAANDVIAWLKALPSN